jgi:hypothetical protein
LSIHASELLDDRLDVGVYRHEDSAEPLEKLDDFVLLPILSHTTMIAARVSAR